MPEHCPSAELLEATHTFPGKYQIKVIGLVDDAFERRVLDAVGAVLPWPGHVEVSTRVTPGGRHVALTLHLTVETAEQVRELYERLHALSGLSLLL